MELSKLLYLGSQFALDVAKKVVTHSGLTFSKEQVLSQPFWYNEKLSNNVMYFTKWYKEGIITISDILDSEGTFLTLEELREIYSLDHINPLNYIRVKTIVTKYMTNHIREEQFHMIKPIMPINIHLINICKKGTSGYYKILEQNKCNEHKMKNKWALHFVTKIGKEHLNLYTSYQTMNLNGSR